MSPSLSPYTVDRHGRQESNIDFLVYSLTIVVHLDVFLLAIVNLKSSLFSFGVSRVEIPRKGFDKDTFQQPSPSFISYVVVDFGRGVARAVYLLVNQSVYSLTIVVHLGSFLLAIVSKNVHFSHYFVSRVSWAPVECTRSGMLSLVLEFIKVSLFPGGCIPERESN